MLLVDLRSCLPNYCGPTFSLLILVIWEILFKMNIWTSAKKCQRMTLWHFRREIKDPVIKSVKMHWDFIDLWMNSVEKSLWFSAQRNCFYLFRDASLGASTYNLTVLDCLHGLYKVWSRQELSKWHLVKRQTKNTQCNYLRFFESLWRSRITWRSIKR